jgi:hypothetical protein
MIDDEEETTHRKKRIFKLIGLVTGLVAIGFGISVWRQAQSPSPIVTLDRTEMVQADQQNNSEIVVDPAATELNEHFEKESSDDLFELCFKARVSKQDIYLKEENRAHCAQIEKSVGVAIDLYRRIKPIELKCDYPIPDTVDGCEGESCSQFSQATLMSDTEMLASLDSRKVSTRLKKGQVLRDPTEFKIVVLKAGKVKVLDRSLSVEGTDRMLARGMIFSTIGYFGEGYLIGCIGRHRFSFDGGAVEFMSDSTTENWVKMTDEQGNSGFVNRDLLETNYGENAGD